MFLHYLATGNMPPVPALRSGWYLRSLTERYVSDGDLKT